MSGRPLHTVEVPNGFTLAMQDRLIVGHMPNVVTAAGSGAGATVTKAFTGLSLPANYSLEVEASQACFVSYTAKTQTGFSIVLTPTAAGVTLSAGTIDVVVIA